MSEIKCFPIASIFSVLTGRLLCSVNDLQEILDFMTRAEIMMHQILRALKVYQNFLSEQYPFLKDDKFHDSDKDFVKEWVAARVERFGKELCIYRMPPGMYQIKCPVEEYMEMKDGL